MNSKPPPGISPDIHELAGEYVLGTLSASSRRGVEARLGTDAELRAAVQAWEDRLLPLAGLAEPVTPSPQLWRRVERSLDALDTAPRRVGQPKPWWRDWNNLALWRGLTAGGFATAALLAALLLTRLVEPPVTRFMVVLVAPDDKAPGWVVQAGASRQIELIPLGAVDVPADKALQFWTKADHWGAPVSLRLVKPGHCLQVPAGLGDEQIPVLGHVHGAMPPCATARRSPFPG